MARRGAGIVAIFLSVAEPVSATRLPGYPFPPPVEPVGDPVADGAPASLRLPGLGDVTIAPMTQATSGNRRCLVRIVARGGPTVTVETLGMGETEALGCGGIRAFGAIPAPAGAARIALLYRAFAPQGVAVVPIVLARTARAGWATDEALTARIAAAPRLRTIDAIRAFVTRKRL